MGKKSASRKNEDQVFCVDHLVEDRIGDNGDAEYLVKWQGYTSDDNTWEPKDNISPSVLKAYRKSKIEQRKQMSETETEKDEEDEEPPRKKRKSQVKKTLGIKRRSAGAAVKESAKKTELPSKPSARKSKTKKSLPKSVKKEPVKSTPKPSKKKTETKTIAASTKKKTSVSKKPSTPNKAQPKKKQTSKTLPADVEWSAGDSFEVEKILNTKTTRAGKLEYLVKWKGWPTKFNSWLPETELAGCKEMLASFKRAQTSVESSPTPKAVTKKHKPSQSKSAGSSEPRFESFRERAGLLKGKSPSSQTGGITSQQEEMTRDEI